MRIHHLSCATFCPLFAELLTPRGHLCTHVLAIESDDGLVLVDTGIGSADIDEPRRRLGLQFIFTTGATLERHETAIEQLARLGFLPTDVRHIVLTHLDPDHAGGLSDFPHARVHVLQREHEMAVGPLPLRWRTRFSKAQLEHGPLWKDYGAGGERWFGFEGVHRLEGPRVEIALVPLHGHTLGHAGVAVRDGDHWLLHAGDAYFHHQELAGKQAPGVLELFQRVMQMDRDQRLANRVRLVELAAQGTVQIFCAHDPDELAAFSSQH